MVDQPSLHIALDADTRLVLSEVLGQDSIDELEAFLSLPHHPLQPDFNIRSPLPRASGSDTLDPKLARAICNILEPIIPLLGTDGTDPEILLSRVQLVHHLLEIYSSVGGDRASILSLETRCGLMYRLGCWYSIGNVKDEWELDERTREIIIGV